MKSLEWLPESYFVDGDKQAFLHPSCQTSRGHRISISETLGEIYLLALDSKTEAEWLPINIEVLFRPLFDPSKIFTEG